MKHRFSHNIQAIHVAVDFLLLNISFLASYFLKFGEWSTLFNTAYSEVLFFVNVAWLLSVLIVKPYHISRVTSTIPHVLGRHFTSIFLHVCLVAVFLVALRVDYYSREQIIIAYIILFVIASFWKGAFTYLLRTYRLQGFNNRRVVVVGYGELAEELKDFFAQHREYGYRLTGFFGDNIPETHCALGSVSQLPERLLRTSVDEIYCCVPYLDPQEVRHIIAFGEQHQKRVKIITDYRSFYAKGISLERYGIIPVLNITPDPVEDGKAVAVKRLFDFSFALVVLVLGAPVFLITALTTKLSSRGPILFAQERIGRNGRPFYIYKFRSMYIDSEQGGPQLACSGDPRITPWGRFMRKIRLDEIPQFYNVLIGDMSIVGPRPERQHYIDQIMAKAPNYRYLQYVKPGITSIGQVKFGYAENIDEMVKRMRYDILYLRNSSLAFDVKIIMLTIMVVLKAEGK
jgi:putative colanic acid biosynthesis UDP-glucose lipid carrier transferase